jgi:prolyl oligopeptidase
VRDRGARAVEVPHLFFLSVMTFDLVHGIRVDDPFRWLEDRQSPRTVEWLDAQAARARRHLDSLPGHADLVTDAARLLAAEVVEGLHVGREATYFLRRAPGDDQASLWMQPAAGSTSTRLLVDAAHIDPSGRTSLEILAVSRDERVLALATRAGCGNEQRVMFVDPTTGETLRDELPASEYRGVVPVPEAGGVYYAAPHDASSWRLAWHRFGSDAAEDVTVFEPEGAGPLKLGVSMAQDGEHLLILTARRGPPRTMDLHVLPTLPVLPMLPMLPIGSADIPRALLGDTEFFGGGVTFDGHLYFVSHEAASNRRVMRVPLSGSVDSGLPEVIIPESDEVIRRVARAGDTLLLVTSLDGHDRIRLFDWDGNPVGAPEAEPTPSGRIIHLACHPERHDFYVAIESWQRPRTIFRWRAPSRAIEKWWERDAPLDPTTLTLEQRECPARDGTRMPLHIIRSKAEAAAAAALPTLLVAYGGYGVTLTPTLSLRNALWLAAGGQIVVAGVRGGGERGRQWHDAGARENRQTAIDDLLDTADWLVAEGFTPADRLALAGASHAGTLVAAAMTQRPDRFAAVICSMALLDLVRFEASPHGRWSAQELGTTSDEAQFRALLAYSPYHRVREVAYPAVLFVSGDADTLVDPLHVRKMAACLQQATTSDRPVLLSYNEHRGHRGQLPLAERARALADQIAFLRAHVSIPQKRSEEHDS